MTPPQAPKLVARDLQTSMTEKATCLHDVTTANTAEITMNDVMI